MVSSTMQQFLLGRGGVLGVGAFWVNEREKKRKDVGA